MEITGAFLFGKFVSLEKKRIVYSVVIEKGIPITVITLTRVHYSLGLFQKYIHLFSHSSTRWKDS